MFRKSYKLVLAWIEIKRFQLLLVATLFVLIIPAFSNSTALADLFFMITMTFLVVQSMVASHVRENEKRVMPYVVLGLVIITWLEPMGVSSIYVDIGKMLAFITFFGFVVHSLLKYIANTENINVNVLLASVIIYLLMGIIGGFLAILLNTLYGGGYNFPANVKVPQMVDYIYYSFITMTTVGYGDITPAIPETKTLAYLLSVLGQLYVAIIIAFLVGKLLVKRNENE